MSTDRTATCPHCLCPMRVTARGTFVLHLVDGSTGEPVGGGFVRLPDNGAPICAGAYADVPATEAAA